MEYYRRKIQLIIWGAILILSILSGFVWRSQVSRSLLEVVFMNVGQGDAILIKTPYEQNILIDGGPDLSVLSELGRNLPFFDKHIDLMILSHPHADHVTGLIGVLERYQVDTVFDTGVSYYSPPYGTWLDLISRKNIPLELINTPRTIELGKDLSLEILYPSTDLAGKKLDKINNASIVLKLIYGDTCFFFTGDAEMEVEEELLERGVDLDCDVLKVGHHGSSSSSTQAFLEAVSPDIAAIQVGRDNEYGHPSLRILRRLERQGSTILRNDIEGTISLVSDSKKIEAK